jgi:glucose-6-phosphate dehydrogenase assembly protein OpcA
VSEDVWSDEGVPPDAVAGALRAMLRERHSRDASLVPAHVLNLVVVIDRDLRGEILGRLERVGRYHASRTILCSIQRGRRQLAARAVLTDDGEPGDATARALRELVDFAIAPEQIVDVATIVDPVLVSELPTVLWCPHGHEEAVQALRRLVDVILIDSDADAADAEEALARAEDLGSSAYTVDLAWLRTTPWRERLAATFDPPYRRCELPCISSVEVRHRRASDASALLLAGWLAERLQWRSGSVAVSLREVAQEAPGLAGVTLTTRDGFSLSLDRGRGGLRARRRRRSGEETSWRVLGASRGEGGILGEGVRQALLRDPTYGPALAAARELVAA